MRPFLYSTELTKEQPANSKFLAGGTTLIDLMKLDVERPEQLIYVKDQKSIASEITSSPNGLRLGALVTMAQAAEHATIKKDYPVIAQSLQLAASQQIRNMATLGGNVLQRTRCSYFRDVSYGECNKRIPGSGCAATGGINRQHAVLGTSQSCIAAYPGDFAQALVALNAIVETDRRNFAFAELHTNSDKPETENILKPGEVIRFIVIPKGNFKRSVYVKVRDRDSYQFALASSAVALDMDGEKVRYAYIALGGVAYKPWKAKAAEAVLEGNPLDENTAQAAATAAFADAKGHEHNQFKIALGQQTLVRALMAAKAMEI